MKVKVDIVSDVVCPWCYIGKSRFEKAVAGLGDEVEVEVNWKPFQLNPDIAPEGEDMREHLSRKYGVSDVQPMIQRVEEAANGEGIPMDLGKVGQVGSTLEAHRLMLLARSEGKAEAIGHRLFQAYFREGANPADKGLLIGLAKEVGLSEDLIARFVATDEGQREVAQEEEFYKRAGISAVPSFIFNDRILVQGGQPETVFADVFKQIQSEEPA